MGLLSKAESARNKKLHKVDKEKKQYIHQVSPARKKVITQEIRKKRKKIVKHLGKELTATPKLKKGKKIPTVKVSQVKTKVVIKDKIKNQLKGIKDKIIAPKGDQETVKDVDSKGKETIPTEETVAAKPTGNKLFDLGSLKAEIKSQFERSHATAAKEGFIYTGVPGFDDLLDNGIPKNGSILVAGGAGSGKTIFCLQTLFHHLAEGKKCIMMSFEESEEKLIGHMEQFGWNPRKYIKKKQFYVKRFNPFEITRSVDALLMQAKGELMIEVDPLILPKGFKPDFIVVDSLTAIASAFTAKDESYRIYIEQLFRFFENIKATALLITETEQVPKIFSTTGVEEFLADGVIVIYNIKRGNIRERAIEILKLRGTSHQNKIVAMSIGEKGVTVYPEQEVFGEIQGP
ncbi:Flp pilus assembly complex ATPase component TadA [Candidatus Woesearchaeota archaeon]|jgi:KaiC/GvpD/RAD55 family RecA-like ATPase|nr:Flp pilus assembly complex ATPase component TadA [Candidatus Woesearchaeota archaeon]MBT4110385.1 Flp pilus assembly complex ATPase component TadA [Candidatus Woesearchaeota archaeon]MBT4336091.1 Flp pilus assembly complex ATPase component TadA [Candidatus Woesearchaeota archaeon]MBT4468930.1 Flp pilus assembly complex ATPase component TadA [Candidatus Woesearchaeota archaeon]MBT6744751.1 Flp pilus assembly complex ATPase component TadA [Candidatus Woesearchaeota archaeon]